jgi:hypothetical protein
MTDVRRVPSTAARWLRRTAGALGLLAFFATAGACAVHEARPTVLYRIGIGDRGITLPLPPPSLTGAPVQPLQVSGELAIASADRNEDADAPAPTPSAVVVYERSSDRLVRAQPQAGPSGSWSFVGELPAVDLRDHCFELWIEDAAGDVISDLAYAQAVIEPDDRSIRTVSACGGD